MCQFAEVYLEPIQTSTVDLFGKIINGFCSLLYAKCSIIVVSLVSKYASGLALLSCYLFFHANVTITSVLIL